MSGESGGTSFTSLGISQAQPPTHSRPKVLMSSSTSLVCLRGRAHPSVYQSGFHRHPRHGKSRGSGTPRRFGRGARLTLERRRRIVPAGTKPNEPSLCPGGKRMPPQPFNNDRVHMIVILCLGGDRCRVSTLPMRSSCCSTVGLAGRAEVKQKGNTPF